MLYKRKERVSVTSKGNILIVYFKFYKENFYFYYLLRFLLELDFKIKNVVQIENLCFAFIIEKDTVS